MSSELVDRVQARWCVGTPNGRQGVESRKLRCGDEIATERRSRVLAHLAELRAPLEGLELDSADHAALAQVADQDVETVFTISTLFRRARAAMPPGGDTRRD